MNGKGSRLYHFAHRLAETNKMTYGHKKSPLFREHYPLLSALTNNDEIFDSANMSIIFDKAKRSDRFIYCSFCKTT